ncbi:Metallo-dependent hydrolase [Punctularia strigosozonata HHB-11173 SS5]|uniref:Metallo-dependent hydrolase n=1 Tax=Punctularia strigosozonata (strain HHB-11173) TaxID=741275 RepID=UPI0004416D0B|nr:Metallo-dependent hydrolase [Punctularia strigosozonata HHB-11173 SS5]EIN12834.1 Metallo-dependent hydrolase [Punctularia strigosozonata HHB-11173 SS5]
MRAHVEVDETVRFACLDVAVRLKQEFKQVCDIHIAVFAQDPLYSPADVQNTEPVNSTLLAEAAARDGVSAIGSAPYVETSTDLARRNISRCIALALAHGLHLDFHLDYNLSQEADPMIYDVISELRLRPWDLTKRITIGHATRLALFRHDEWRELVHAIGNLPISFVGLPQSDLYMMGRNAGERGPGMLAVRGTLNTPSLSGEHNLRIAMSVNNVQNAFTPQGSVDPLGLCPLAIAVFQDGTAKACEALLRSVTIASKHAVGEADVPAGLAPQVADRADFVILHDNDSVQSAALSPSYARTTIKSGTLVAQRRTSSYIRTQ